MDMKTIAEQLEEVGVCALASIRELVAALDCDYDRLEELRDQARDECCDVPIRDADGRYLSVTEIGTRYLECRGVLTATDNFCSFTDEVRDRMQQLEEHHGRRTSGS